MASRAKATATTDHDEIRRWAEERGARPACVRGTGRKGDMGMIRLDFPGFSGGDSLEEISWNDWFRSFDENGLALLRQETTAGGQKSKFTKLIARETAAGRQPDRRRASSRRASTTSRARSTRAKRRNSSATSTSRRTGGGRRTSAKATSRGPKSSRVRRSESRSATRGGSATGRGKQTTASSS